MKTIVTCVSNVRHKLICVGWKIYVRLLRTQKKFNIKSIIYCVIYKQEYNLLGRFYNLKQT
jgi:hypothetical protein